jgi:hypothetical protein
MFDDLFLFAVAANSTEDKNLFVLSVRKTSQFDFYREQGWNTFINSEIVVGEHFAFSDDRVTFIDQGRTSKPVDMILGDLAAYNQKRLDAVLAYSPLYIKADYVTSLVDGSAFLPSEGEAVMRDRAVTMVNTLIAHGYHVLASTWYSNDHQSRTQVVADAADMGTFPCNLIFFKDPSHIDEFKRYEKLFEQQFNSAMVLQNAKGQADANSVAVYALEKKVKKCENYILMMEEAMISLQPSEKIKI